MRKRKISPAPLCIAPSGQAWLDVERRASVEVTSEENGYPIESALLEAEDRGWRAADPGTQTIRLIFDEPQDLRRIWLVLRITRIHARKSSSCDGLLTVAILFEKSCASSGTSAHPIQYGKQRTTLSNSPL
jgi:hypothetical protein